MLLINHDYFKFKDFYIIGGIEYGHYIKELAPPRGAIVTKPKTPK
jgi:hypothetical protein